MKVGIIWRRFLKTNTVSNLKLCARVHYTSKYAVCVIYTALAANSIKVGGFCKCESVET